MKIRLNIPDGLLAAAGLGALTWYLHKEKIIPVSVEKAALDALKAAVDNKVKEVTKHGNSN